MKILIALLFLANIVAFSAAGFPESISYQGILTDENGDIVADGEYTATFTLHGHSSASNELWSEEKTFSTEDGVFNVVLGSDTPFTEDNYEFGDQGIWLEIHLQGETNPLDPRIEINSVPFSRAAYSIDNGKINNTEIGAESPSAATFTTVQVNTSVDINGGTIDGTAIGTEQRSTGSFTTMEALTAYIKDGTIEGTDIGGIEAAAATFTDINTSSSFFYIPNTISEGMVLVSNGDGSASWTTFSGGTDLTASETITIPNSVSEGEVLTADGNGEAYWQEPSQSGSTVTTLSGNQTLTDKDQVVIVVDADHDITLPADPREGQIIHIYTNRQNVEIDPNGNSLWITGGEYTIATSLKTLIEDNYGDWFDGQQSAGNISLIIVSDGDDWYVVGHSFDSVTAP
jgi:hypothetical protein